MHTYISTVILEKLFICLPIEMYHKDQNDNGIHHQIELNLVWTHWPLGDVAIILKVEISNSCYELNIWAFPFEVL